jgi:tryptophan synthase alpha chain
MTKMTSISHHFQSLRNRNYCALIPFITAGDPNLDITREALHILDRSGADFIELGIPYSDPLADGPVIQAAATRALQRGTKLEQVLEMLTSISPNLLAPVILFTYYNVILNRGIQAFVEQVAYSGAKGLVVPDLPLEEAKELIQTAAGFGIEVILLVTPTTSKQRMKEIAHWSGGFVYLVSVTGVTGMRSLLDDRVKNLIEEMRHVTDKAIGVGFGISGSEQAHQVMNWGADAVIVGSAFVKLLANSDSIQGLQAVEELCKQLKASIIPTSRLVVGSP